MIIVTGGAGFIGSNIVKALNDKGITDILVVDNLKDGTKFVNLVDLNIADYMDKEDFLIQIMAGEEFGEIEAIFHEGACSSTTEWDGKYMMDNNYQYSKELLHYCPEREIPFLYASSAATYGGRTSDFHRVPRVRTAAERLRLLQIPVRRIRPPDPAGSQFADRRLPLL